MTLQTDPIPAQAGMGPSIEIFSVYGLPLDTWIFGWSLFTLLLAV